jgi:hypothetical protein
VRDAIEQLLRAHEPNPALVVDRHWGLVSANRAVAVLIAGVTAQLLEPPVNVLRLSLHPDGLAPRIANLREWRDHLVERVAREAIATGDPALASLRDELAAYPAGPESGRSVQTEIAVPLRLRHGEHELSFISTQTTFGTAVDVTVAEFSIESFFPADAETADAMRELAPRP